MDYNRTNKGQFVFVRAIAKPEYDSENNKVISTIPMPKPMMAIVIGRTKRAIGHYIKGKPAMSSYNGYMEAEQAQLQIEAWVKLIMVEFLGSESYFLPELAYATDLLLIHAPHFNYIDTGQVEAFMKDQVMEWLGNPDSILQETK